VICLTSPRIKRGGSCEITNWDSGFGLYKYRAGVCTDTCDRYDRGVQNGASFVKGQAVSPGALVSLFGSNLANSQAVASSVPISDQAW